MILPAVPGPPLSPVERYGLGVLLDQARLLPMEEEGADVVRLVLEGQGESQPDAEVLLRARPAVSDGVVSLSRAAVAAAGRLVAAAEEQATDAADRLSRVPAGSNPLVRAGCSEEPVVSRLAVRLRDAAVAAAGPRPVRLLAPWPDGKRWAACLTSDLDLVSGWPAATGLRLVELGRHGAFGRIPTVLAAAGRGLFGDPVSQAAQRLLASLARRRFTATWFIISGTPTVRSWLRGDITYRPEARRARRISEAVLTGGHEIGLHGSFATMVDSARLGQERERLERLTGREVLSSRQHFLRMRPGATQRALAKAGLRQDASFGFADRNGFRLGVADVVPGWDITQEATIGLDEVPLVWMDRALSKYGGIEDPEQWVAEGLLLAQRCREVNGLWTGLWHPNLDPALGFPGAEHALEALLDGLAAGSPYVAPIGELVQWRQRRRAARATTLLPDGTPVVRGASGLALEYSDGTPASMQAVEDRS